MGRFKPALQDLTKVVELKPDFTSVRLHCFSHLYSSSKLSFND